MITHRLTTVLSLTLFAIALLGGFAASADWPQWRGPNANGVAPEGNPPTKWSEKKNVKWKVKVEGSVSDEELETIHKLCKYSPVHGLIADAINVTGRVTRA